MKYLIFLSLVRQWPHFTVHYAHFCLSCPAPGLGSGLSSFIFRTMLKLLAYPVALMTLVSCQRETAATADCIDPSKIKADAMCTMEYAPVCGCNNQTYSNACQATNAGVKAYAQGPCPDTGQPKGQ